MYQFTDFTDRAKYVSGSQILQIGQICIRFTDFTDMAKYVSCSQILQIRKNMYQFTDFTDRAKYVFDVVKKNSLTK